MVISLANPYLTTERINRKNPKICMMEKVVDTFIYYREDMKENILELICEGSVSSYGGMQKR